MTRRPTTIDARALILDESVDDRLAEWTQPPPTPARYGARRLLPSDRAVIDRETRGESHQRHAFGSLLLAVRAAADYRDTGASVTSAAAPGRFGGGGHASGSGRQSNVTRGVDHVAGVLRALAGIGPVDVGGHVVPGAIAQDVLVWRVAGETYRRGHATARRDCTVARVAELVLERHGIVLTKRQVAIVTRHAKLSARTHLEGTGEIPVARREAEPGEWEPRQRSE